MIYNHLPTLSALQATPALIYNERDIVCNFLNMQKGLTNSKCRYKIYYAMKSCYDRNVMDCIFRLGCGVEIMSNMEFELANSIPNKPNGILLGGIGRSEQLFKQVIDEEGQIIIDSIYDLYRLQVLSKKLCRKINIGIRIRPDFSILKILDKASPYDLKSIKLGLLPFSQEFNAIVREIKYSEYLNLSIIHCHFCINMKAPDIAVSILQQIKNIYDRMYKEGHGENIEAIDIGGGFGAFSSLEYDKAQEMFNIIGKEFCLLFPNFCLYLEPGRYLSNSSGYVFAKILDIKKDGDVTFLFTEASTNVLIPIPTANYKLIHPAPCDRHGYKVTITDGITSPNNVVIENIFLSSIPGVDDYIIIGNCGAYTSVLQHFWAYEPFSTYFIDINNHMTNNVTKEEILNARKILLGI